MRAFPKWLFDILLLIQSENVTVAIFLSIPKAPPVLQKELKEMKAQLEDDPASAEVFLSFLEDYRISGVENIMRKLYSLNMGTGGNGEVMNVIIDSNLSMLAEGERKKIETKGQMVSIYYMIPMIPVMATMCGYGITLMVVIFRNVMSVL
jgi:hypothetical protein